MALGIVEGLRTLTKGVTSVLEWIPGVATDSFKGVNDALTSITESTAGSMAGLVEELNGLLLAPLPGDAVKAKFAAIQAAAQENAIILNEVRIQNNNKELTAAQIHAQNLIKIENQKTRELTKVRKKELTDLEKFTALSYQNQTKQVSGELVNMTQGVASSSKAMFKINKAAGIANAVINTSQGVTKALSAYPPPLSYAMAAGQLAAGVAQVNAIKSTSFGGGTVPSLSGASSAPVTTAPNELGQDLPLDEARATKNITIEFSGASRYSKDEVRDLIDQINIEIGDGATLAAA